ncbi:hypothetical protein L6164_004981 [Bauhinia variegata]|uniref:Uncharacterized protein n=1 Tax=Bauhinia variegata TaxID=167791 RepID=A0ACB9PPK1_BAUVA|nr:hypothetical protein L6164_004981 [Bauhinia variegata]
MVLGLRAKNRTSPTVQINYLIHIQEIKPWPPSQALRSLRSVLIQWENGERRSGSTNLVVPSLGSVIGEGRIEFNESFRLPVTLLRDLSVRGGDADVFQKNCLEFNLYEPRRDKTKGQLLGTAIIDLADYGILKEALSISAPLNCKRSYRNTDQPLLFIKIQPVEKGRTNSSSKESLSKDNNGGDSVSALMNEEYAEEAEIASFTDDDVSSHSSTAIASTLESNGCIPPGLEENGQHGLVHDADRNGKEHPRESEKRFDKSNMMPQDKHDNLGTSSSCMTSIDQSSDGGSLVNGDASLSNSPSHSSVNHDASHINDKFTGRYEEADEYFLKEGVSDALYCSSIEDKQANGKSNLDEQNDAEDEPSVAQGAKDHILLSNSAYSIGGVIGEKGNILKNESLKPMKSVRSPADSARSVGSLGSNHHPEVKESVVVGDAQNSWGNIRGSDKKDSKIYPKEVRSAILESKIQHLENKIKMLEGELREAAAIEAALYSVVAEHGSSMNKVHAPARRLSRLYLHTCKEKLQSRRAGAAKSAVSGLVLVSKACGNDVPRLTYWLSNSIVLRIIISQTTKEAVPSFSAGSRMKGKSEVEGRSKMTPLFQWKGSSPRKTGNTTIECEGFGNWDDPHVFTSALEKIEAWIFSRIVESIWWQTLTPHMQHAKVTNKEDVSSALRKSSRRISSSHDQEQGIFSLDIWKSAFREACERLCPIRAGGHECGCLPVLSRLIMEQCVARLDVAMFNAILRESADEIPTDPVSDPISDPKVLPIPPGKSSFGAGAQLKNAIGTWSIWLTDLFGMDDDDSIEDNDDADSNADRQNTSFKSFHLLNALSDLLMLPKDMLFSQSIRNEVCPMFSASLIKRILDNFVPDEFCPDPIPTAVLEALNSEEDFQDGYESVKIFPCIATPIVYLPPSASSIASITGEIGNKSQLRRSRSSVIRKAYTSDDELDELTSPFSLIDFDSSMSPSVSTKRSWKSKEIQSDSAVRYELLRKA